MGSLHRPGDRDLEARARGLTGHPGCRWDRQDPTFAAPVPLTAGGKGARDPDNIQGTLAVDSEQIYLIIGPRLYRHCHGRPTRIASNWYDVDQSLWHAGPRFPSGERFCSKRVSGIWSAVRRFRTFPTVFMCTLAAMAGTALVCQARDVDACIGSNAPAMARAVESRTTATRCRQLTVGMTPP
jgi:hypothetical protein